MIKLESPGNGVCISLQNSMQKDFLINSGKYLSGELDIQSFRLQAPVFCDPSIPAKVSFSWSEESVAESKPMKIEISKNADFKDALVYENVKSPFETYNFECNATYYWRVKNDDETSGIFSFRTQDVSPRFLYAEGTATNIRDIGGYVTEDNKRIRQGLLIRGSEMDMHMDLSENGKKTMREVFGIKTDIDLRKESIGVVFESPLGKDIKYIQIPLRDYMGFVSKENHKNIADIFEILSEKNNYPIYFHCWGGADRTGSLAFMMEALLGVCEESLMLDYELTSICRYDCIRSRDSDGFSDMVKFFREMGTTWQERMTNFVLDCGVPACRVERFKEIMLEDNGG